MARFASIAELHTNDVIPQTWTVPVPDAINYLTVPGANIAAIGASNTATITAKTHLLTAVAGNVDNIADASGAVAGQPVELICTNAQTVRNNAGGTGNIRTLSGADYAGSAGEVLRFVFDGTSWRLLNVPSGLNTYTWATLPIAAALNSYALLSDSWAGDGAVVAAAPVSVLLQFKNTDATQPWEPVDGTNQEWIEWLLLGGSSANGWTNKDAFTCPAKITVRGKIGGAYGGTNSGATVGLALGTTSGGTEIVSSTATGALFGSIPDATAGAGTTIAAASKIYMNSNANSFGTLNAFQERFKCRIVKIAGRV